MNVGDPIPLGLQLWDLAEDKFVRAKVYDKDGVELVGSPVTLPHLDDGFYYNASIPFPNSLWVVCVFYVFDDGGFTQISDSHTPAAETIFLDQAYQTLLDFEIAEGTDVSIKLLDDENEELLAAIGDDEMLKAKVSEDDVIKGVLMPEGSESSEVINIIEGAKALVGTNINDSGAAQPAYRAWAWGNGNAAVLASATDFQISDFAGINTESAAEDAEMEMVRSGLVVGALAGMSLNAGDILYLSDTPGVLTTTPPALPSVKVIIGQAEPSVPGDTGPAEDLFIQLQLIG